MVPDVGGTSVEPERANDEPETANVEPETGNVEPERDDVEDEARKDVFFRLVRGIMTAVLEESAVRLAEEMVKFRRFLAHRMLQCNEDKMQARIDLLTLDRGFRASCKAWIEKDKATREDAAYSAFESCLGVYDEEDNVER